LNHYAPTFDRTNGETRAHASPDGSRPPEAALQAAAEIAARHAADVDRDARFPHEAIDALRTARLLGAAIPKDLGGGGAGMVELARTCEILGRQCASTAMIYAMHAIQVACVVRHRQSSEFFERYLANLAAEQGLIASVTSEMGVGGELRASVAAVERRAGRVAVMKHATTISYGATADALLLTARSSADAPASDQVLVLLRRGEYVLEQTGAWDTMGMRGTCSPGFRVTADATEAQVLPVRFAEIATHTMVPYSHVLWSSCWLGIATAAMSRARAFVRQQARAKPGSVPPTATRLAEAWSLLQAMRNNVWGVARECDERMEDPARAAELASASFALKLNNLKLSTSQLVFEIVHRALLICGIAGYKNDSPAALGRHLRDACSAELMIGSDRICASSASMLLVLKDD
jgi:acyl-CoA dehydrogenase